MNHIIDTLPKFREIIEKLEIIKLAVVKGSEINYTSQDARMVALDSLQISISAVGMWIKSVNSLSKYFTQGGSFNENGFLDSVGSGLNIEQTEKVMFDHLRLGFITLAHFKIDSLFHNILKYLKALPDRTGYWNLTDQILDLCSLSKTGAEKQYLTAFANLRNSLHGNGIHKTAPLSITIDGIAFHFIKGKRVECASWNHVIVLLNSNVDILGKILLSHNVENIKTEIEDDFASGN